MTTYNYIHNDYMKEGRSAVFKEEYDYKSINGTLASEYICNDVFLQWPEGIVSENGF